MRKKHGIRSPRTPKGESAETTICIQHNEIVFLTNRIAELVAERDELLKKFYDQDQLLVTIAEQEKRIKILVERSDGLVEFNRNVADERNKARDQVRKVEEDLALSNMMLDGKVEILAGMERANSRMSGWQDCAREVFQSLAMVEK